MIISFCRLLKEYISRCYQFVWANNDLVIQSLLINPYLGRRRRVLCFPRNLAWVNIRIQLELDSPIKYFEPLYITPHTHPRSEHLVYPNGHLSRYSQARLFLSCDLTGTSPSMCCSHKHLTTKEKQNVLLYILALLIKWSITHSLLINNNYYYLHGHFDFL